MTALGRVRLLQVITLAVLSFCSCTDTRDEKVSDHLILRLSAGWEAMYPDRASFELRFQTNGPTIMHLPDGVTLWANGVKLPPPSDWSELHTNPVEPGQGFGIFWHFGATDLFSWIGGQGTHELYATLGTARSNSVTISFPHPQFEPAWPRR